MGAGTTRKPTRTGRPMRSRPRKGIRKDHLMDPLKARAFLFHVYMKGVPLEPETLSSETRTIESARRIFDRLFLGYMPLPHSLH